MFQRKQNSEQAESKITMVKLKNGSEVAKPVVIALMINLEALMKSNPIAFYELVEKCKNSEHEMFGHTKDVVTEWALIDSNGSVNSAVRDVVLSAVEGEELSMSLGNPVAPQSSISNKM